MKTLRSILRLLTAGILVSGCSKVIDVDLPAAAPKLVIDASIDWDKATAGNDQKIILSTSTGYYSEEFPTVSGATIHITNSSGTVFYFIEGSKAGEYLCTNFNPVVGETYDLMVSIGSITYVARETLTATPDLNPDIFQTDQGGMTGDEMEIEYSYQDDGSEENYYVSRVKTQRVAFPVFELENDENTQGQKMTEFYSHEDLASGDDVNIRLYAVSRRFFEYFRKVLSASGGDGSPFPTIPTAARGNIINQQNPDDYPLGYFRLCQVSTADYQMK